MKIIIEKKFETYTTEFTNVDVSMEQIAKALTGMLLSYGWDIETIKEHIKTEEDILINTQDNYENN
jgi:hypothetical protein